MIGLFMENSGKEPMSITALSFENKIETFKKFTKNYLIALYEMNQKYLLEKKVKKIKNSKKILFHK